MAKTQGRERVRLSKGTPEQSVKAMHEGRAKSHKKAPRRENGKVIQGYKYKELLEGYRENGLEPHVINGPMVTKPRTPMFVDQPSLAKRIIKFIRKGYPYTTVCRYVGVTPKTFKEWLERGKAGVSPEYVRFYERVARAEAHAEMQTLENLKRHGKADWRVSAWQLERRWPEHWAKKDRIAAELTVNSNVQADSKEHLGKAVVQDLAARELARRLISGDEFGYTDITDQQSLEDHSEVDDE